MRLIHADLLLARVDNSPAHSRLLLHFVRKQAAVDSPCGVRELTTLETDVLHLDKPCGLTPFRLPYQVEIKL
jgi:hypothetical protein